MTWAGPKGRGAQERNHRGKRGRSQKRKSRRDRNTGVKGSFAASTGAALWGRKWPWIVGENKGGRKEGRETPKNAPRGGGGQVLTSPPPNSRQCSHRDRTQISWKKQDRKRGNAPVREKTFSLKNMPRTFRTNEPAKESQKRTHPTRILGSQSYAPHQHSARIKKKGYLTGGDKTKKKRKAGKKSTPTTPSLQPVKRKKKNSKRPRITTT